MNNNDHLDKFISEIESIKMTLNEKNEMRDHLTSFAMHYTPIVSPYHKTILIMRRSLAIAFVAILSVGSLSNVASGNALPNDILYPVKIAHEEFKLATTVDTKKKISYEIRRTEKRIQEATELATQNDLDSETQTEIAETIKKQANKVKERIEEVKEDNPEEALILNAEFKSTIKINAEALKQVSTSIEQQKVEPEPDEIIETVTEEVVKMDGETIDETELNSETIEDEEINETADKIEIIEETTEVEYITVEVSFAESLLESIEKEVKEIEAFENEVSEELVKKEEAEEIINNTTEGVFETKESEIEIIETEEETIDVGAIEEEINSLNDILDLKKQIKDIKNELTLSEDLLALTENFDEADIYLNVDLLINDGKYKKAFILLQQALTYYQEQLIVKDLAFDLGIQLIETFDTIEVLEKTIETPDILVEDEQTIGFEKEIKDDLIETPSTE